VLQDLKFETLYVDFDEVGRRQTLFFVQNLQLDGFVFRALRDFSVQAGSAGNQGIETHLGLHRLGGKAAVTLENEFNRFSLQVESLPKQRFGGLGRLKG